MKVHNGTAYQRLYWRWCVRWSNLITGLEGLEGSRRVKLPDFKTIGTLRLKVVNTTHRPPLPPPPKEIFLVLIYVRSWVSPMAIGATGRIMSKKNSSDTIGNRTRHLPACTATLHEESAHSIHTGSADYPVSIHMDTAVFCPRVKAKRAWPDHLASRLRMHGGIPPFTHRYHRAVLN